MLYYYYYSIYEKGVLPLELIAIQCMDDQTCSQKLQLGGSFVQNYGPFEQNSGLFNNLVVFSNKIVDNFGKFVAFSNKIVDLFGKIVDLLFERGVLQHLENPPGYGLDDVLQSPMYI